MESTEVIVWEAASNDEFLSSVATARRITKSGAFESSEQLAVVDGDIGDNATSTKIAGCAMR
jgi:hypothetical protein